MSAQPLARMTPEEYLEADRAAEIKSEYYDGHMYPMAGGTLVHGLIIGNITGVLNRALDDRNCLVIPTGLRVRVSYAGLYTYPDILVICGEPQYADAHDDVVLNPRLIIEVLFKSTEGHDRGFKFAQYRKLDSLQEYVLVGQKEPRVERFLRQPNGQWVFIEYAGLAAEAEFESIGCRISLADIFRKVNFPASQDENRMI